MPSLTAVYNKIISTPLLTDKLAIYNNGQNIPAVFIGKAPLDSEMPCIVISQKTTNRDDTTRGNRGGNVFIDVTVWGNKDNSQKSLRDLSMLVWKTLDRACLEEVSGFVFQGCYCNMPVQMEGSDGFPCFVLSLNVSMLEK